MARFNKLDIPHQWKDEFTKYPHGYSIFEAISKWVDQINKMVTNINQWNEYLGGFTSTFGEVPQHMVELRQEMTDLIASVNSDLTTITDEINGLAETLLSHLSNYTSYLGSELGEEHIIRTLPNGTKDEISDGKLYKRVSDEIVFNGGENWGLGETLEGTYRFQLPNNMGIPTSFLATKYLVVNGVVWEYSSGYSADKEHFYIDETFILKINKSTIDNHPNGSTVLGKFKDWLSATLTYQLAEPEIIDLPEVMTPNTREITRLSEQVDKLTSAIINLGGTII